MGIIIIIVLACAVAVIDRKVEAAERQEELEEYIEAICEPRHICPELVEAGRLYCEKHLLLHPEVTRPAAKRGYNRRWQKARKSYLEAHPLCVQCAKQGKYVRATVVDHIIPHRGDQKLFWDQNNWQALCKSCHDKKTLTEDINPTYTY